MTSLRDMSTLTNLPKHIIDNIFEYDNTYREIYSKCMIELINYMRISLFTGLSKYTIKNNKDIHPYG